MHPYMTKTQQRKEKRFLCTRRPGGHAAAMLEQAFYSGQVDGHDGVLFSPPFPKHAVARRKAYAEGYHQAEQD